MSQEVHTLEVAPKLIFCLPMRPSLSVYFKSLHLGQHTRTESRTKLRRSPTSSHESSPRQACRLRLTRRFSPLCGTSSYSIHHFPDAWKWFFLVIVFDPASCVRKYHPWPRTDLKCARLLRILAFHYYFLKKQKQSPSKQYIFMVLMLLSVE